MEITLQTPLEEGKNYQNMHHVRKEIKENNLKGSLK